jgi:hypothetical protein
MAASVLAFLHANRSQKYAVVLFLLSGALLAVAYSCRSMAVILLPFFFIYAMLFERKFKWTYLLFAAGFLTLILSECAYFLMEGLSPLHNFRLNANAAVVVNTSGECSTSLAYYPAVIFQNLRVFGPYFFLFLPALILPLVKRDRGALIILAWAATILVILQFGFISFFPPIPIVKVRKFLNFATVPLILLAAWALMQFRRPAIRWTVVAVLVAASGFLIWPFRYPANQTPEAVGGNMRKVEAYLQGLPLKPIYADMRTIRMLRIISSFELEPDRFRNLYDVSSPYELKDCYVVIHKFYIRFDETKPVFNVPRFLVNYPFSIPDTWKGRDFFQSAVYEVP